jgi:hypothetical protein
MQRYFLVPIGKQVAGQVIQDSLHQEHVVHLRKGIRKTKVCTGWRRISINALVSSFDKEWHSRILDHPQLACSERQTAELNTAAVSHSSSTKGTKGIVTYQYSFRSPQVFRRCLARIRRRESRLRPEVRWN